jgi:hypothetical protein
VVKGAVCGLSHTDFAVTAKNPDWLRRGLGFNVLDGEGHGRVPMPELPLPGVENSCGSLIPSFLSKDVTYEPGEIFVT